MHTLKLQIPQCTTKVSQSVTIHSALLIHTLLHSVTVLEHRNTTNIQIFPDHGNQGWGRVLSLDSSLFLSLILSACILFSTKTVDVIPGDQIRKR